MRNPNISSSPLRYGAAPVRPLAATAPSAQPLRISPHQHLPHAAVLPPAAPCGVSLLPTSVHARRWLLLASSCPLRRGSHSGDKNSCRSGVNISARPTTSKQVLFRSASLFNANVLLLFSNVVCLVGLFDSWMKSCSVCCLSLFCTALTSSLEI